MVTSPVESPSTTEAEDDRRNWRTFWQAAVITTVVIGILMAVFVANYPDNGNGETRDQQARQSQEVGARPHIIERPENGRGPSNPGDPGGWEQLMLLGLIVVGVTAVGLGMWRSVVKARRVSATSSQPPTAPQ